MGCGACTSVKQPSHLPKAPMLHKVANQLYSELASLPSPRKYQSRLLKWIRIKQRQSMSPQPFVAFAQLHPAKFSEKLIKGPPCEYRWDIWKAAVQPIEASEKYSQLLAMSLPDSVTSDIEKDVLRTYYEFAYFKGEGKVALTNVLKCLALEDPEVGYCQGLNFVVGMLLLVSGGNEASTYEFYSSLRKKQGWCQMYVTGFPKLWELTYQWRALFKSKLPNLYRHFKAQGVQEGLWFTKLVMTVFVMAVPLTLAIRLWDILLADSSSIFLKVAWTLLDLVKEDVVGKDISSIAETFRNLPKRQIDIERFLRDVRKVNISQEILDRGLEKFKKKYRPVPLSNQEIIAEVSEVNLGVENL